MSDVWNYFEKEEVGDKVKGKCKKCDKHMSCNKGSTSAMRSHIMSCWKVLPKTRESAPSASKKIRLELPQPQKSLAELMVSLVAVDNISINAIAKSDILHYLFSKEGFDLPRSPTTIMEMIHDYAAEKKQQLTKEIKEMIQKGEKFSLDLDEWTSERRRKYMNINLQCEDETKNLGLIPLNGSSDAYRCVNEVKFHLKKFEIDLDQDIVAITTDGASVMKKFGKIIEAEHKICDNHTLHLAVCDVLYDRAAEAVITESDDFPEEKFVSSENYEILEEEEIKNMDLMDSNTNPFVVEQEIDEEEWRKSNIYKNLKGIREIVKVFRKSTLKNAALQENIKRYNGKELELILDMPTRWNSIPKMTSRFIENKIAIKETLQELQLDYLLENVDFEYIGELNSILEPIAISVTQLEARKCDLLESERILETLCEVLEEMNNVLSLKFRDAITFRVNNRRNKNLISAARYFQNPDNLEKIHRFQHCSKKQTIAFIKKLHYRLFPSVEEEISKETDSNVEENNTSNNFLERLNSKRRRETLMESLNERKNPNSFKRELALFENTNKHTESINKMINAIKTIHATSTESERVFSVASRFSTKFRAKLTDESLDCLVFLKLYLKGKNQV